MLSSKARAFKQQTRTGLCGPYAIVNALSQLGIANFDLAGAAAIVRDLASTLPCGFQAVMREGTDRAQMEQMLAAARARMARLGSPAWSWDALHPRPGEVHADRFWSDLRVKLAEPSTAAIVGFGDDNTGNPAFEPHWTGIARIGPHVIHLFDCDEYDTIHRSDTAVRPERGWEIEDCFILGGVDR